MPMTCESSLSAKAEEVTNRQRCTSGQLGGGGLERSGLKAPGMVATSPHRLYALQPILRFFLSSGKLLQLHESAGGTLAG